MGKPRVIITVTNNLVTDNRLNKLVTWLVQRGYDVLSVGRVYPGGAIPSKGRVGRAKRFNLLFNKGVLFYAEINTRLFFYLLFQGVDKIVAIDLDTLLAARMAAWVKRVPVVFDSHEYFPEVPELVHRPLVKKVWLLLEKLLVPRISVGLTVSQGIVDIYKRLYNVDFILVRNIPSVAGEIFPIRLDASNPVVYYQGALNIGRGLEETIKAMQFLPGYHFKIIGSGDIEIQLRELSVSLGLQDQVTFIGALPFEELSKHAIQAHVGICLLENLGLNYYHSLPNRIFDYPRLGLPVIATSFPDISAVVNEYDTGILLDTLEPREIARAIKGACENMELRERWKFSLHRAAESLSWENEVKALEKIF